MAVFTVGTADTASAVEALARTMAWARGIPDHALPQAGVATLTRTSVAYEPLAGAQVAAGTPRFGYGKRGLALLLEDATTNLLTNNQSNVETDTTGFSALGSGTAIARSLAEKYAGSASLAVTSDGSGATKGVTVSSVVAAASTIYTASLRIKAPVGSKITVVLEERTAADAYIAETNQAFTINETWQKLSLTRTLGAGAGRCRILVYTTTAQAITFYLDVLQIEQKAFATSWHAGGTSRNIERLDLPTSVGNAGAGTVHVLAYVSSVQRRQVANNFTSVFEMLRSVIVGNSNGILVYHSPTTVNWVLETRNDANTSATTTTSDTATPDGWHVFSVCWDATSAKLFIDGVLKGTIAAPPIPSGFSAISLGGRTTTNMWNGLFDTVRFSNTKHADATIAADAATLLTGAASLSLDSDTTALAPFDGALPYYAYAVQDALARVASFPRAEADSAPASDALSRLWTGSRGIADSAPASDALFRLATWFRQLSDSAPASDALERSVAGGRVVASLSLAYEAALGTLKWDERLQPSKWTTGAPRR